jgi:hypothetical protein
MAREDEVGAVYAREDIVGISLWGRRQSSFSLESARLEPATVNALT